MVVCFAGIDTGGSNLFDRRFGSMFEASFMYRPPYAYTLHIGQVIKNFRDICCSI
jgi:hypothetical protein